VQLSRALGHHSASFALDTYVHLLEGEEAPALDLTNALDGSTSKATSRPSKARPTIHPRLRRPDRASRSLALSERGLDSGL